MDELTPFLRNLGEKKEGFKVPEKYFEGIEDAVFQKITAQGARKAPPMSATSGGLMYRLLRAPMLYAAAAAVTLLITAWWFMRPVVSPAATALETELTEAELQAYITENITEFEVEQLATLCSDDLPADAYPLQETTPSDSQKIRARTQAKTFHPEDIRDLLDDMSEEELEEIL